MSMDTIWVITGGPLQITRGWSRDEETKQEKPLKVKELAMHINLFLDQMSNVLVKNPP